MGEQVGGVHKVRALIWGFSSSSGKSRSSSSRWGTHLSSCSFQRFMPSCEGSRHIGTVFVTSGTCLSHWERVCHPAHSGGSCPPVGVLVASGTCSSCRSSSRLFQRFVPSNGGSLRVLGGPSRCCQGMCSSCRSSSHSFHRFLPSCGGSL